MGETLTTIAAAEALGVPVTTLKGWLSQVPVPTERDNAGRRRFTAEALEVLEAVKELRGEGRTFETIRRRVPSVAHSSTDGLSTNEPDAGPTNSEFPTVAQPLSDLRELAALVAASVAEVVRTETDLAEKYARATFTIGELQERVRGLESDRDRMAGLLASGDDVRADRERLAGELAAARDRVAQFEATPPRPWWKVWG